MNALSTGHPPTASLRYWETMQPLTLFGPQRLEPCLREEFDHRAIDGKVAAITAGWQEREAENDELQEHLGRPVIDLKLHARADQVFDEDPELFEAHRARQDHLQALQRLYRFRLEFSLEAARQLVYREGENGFLEPARREAIDAVRLLDQQHLERIAAVHAEFEERWNPRWRPAVARHRNEIAAILGSCAAVGIAGGHVAVLLNRMRLFDLGELLPKRPVFAWSAGAMCLGRRIVLFHDYPPQGPGNAEVFDVGLGLYHGLLALPHASQRLRLSDPARIRLLARRFSPDLCVALDSRVSIRLENGVWRRGQNTRHLTVDGQLLDLEQAA
jgi:hypothetical protein